MTDYRTRLARSLIAALDKLSVSVSGQGDGLRTGEIKAQIRNVWDWKDKFRLGIEFVGLVVLICYANTTRNLWRESRRQTFDSEIAARKQFRAYVLPTEAKMAISKDGRSAKISIRAKNSGQTPAYNVIHWESAGLTMSPGDDASVLRQFRRQEGLFRFEEPGEVSADFGRDDPFLITKLVTFSEPLSTGTETVYVWGHIKYRDTFQVCQYDKFLFRRAGLVERGKEFLLDEIYSIAGDATSVEDPSVACDQNNTAKDPPLER